MWHSCPTAYRFSWIVFEWSHTAMTGHLFWIGDLFKLISDNQSVNSHNLPNSGYWSDQLIKFFKTMVTINELSPTGFGLYTVLYAGSSFPIILLICIWTASFDNHRLEFVFNYFSILHGNEVAIIFFRKGYYLPWLSILKNDPGIIVHGIPRKKQI